jgi:hypothetical protein
MSDIDKVLGFVFPSARCGWRLMSKNIISPILVGTYGNSILYTLELLAVIQYYSTSKHNNQDSRLFQAMVYFTFVVDTVSTVVNYACVYFVCDQIAIFFILIWRVHFLQYTVTYWGTIFVCFCLCFDGIPIILHCRRRCSFPRNKILAMCCLVRNNFHFRDDCAMFLSLWLLEDVSHFAFASRSAVKSSLWSLRSKNKYVTSLLILFVLAEVCLSPFSIRNMF